MQLRLVAGINLLGTRRLAKAQVGGSKVGLNEQFAVVDGKALVGKFDGLVEVLHEHGMVGEVAVAACHVGVIA